MHCTGFGAVKGQEIGRCLDGIRLALERSRRRQASDDTDTFPSYGEQPGEEGRGSLAEDVALCLRTEGDTGAVGVNTRGDLQAPNGMGPRPAPCS
jgi:hypothetical protein